MNENVADRHLPDVREVDLLALLCSLTESANGHRRTALDYLARPEGDAYLNFQSGI